MANDKQVKCNTFEYDHFLKIFDQKYFNNKLTFHWKNNFLGILEKFNKP